MIDRLDAGTLERWWALLIREGEVVVATERGVAVGMARFGAADDDPGRGHLYSLYVDPDASGAGIGRMLLAHVTSQLAAAGYATATLWVFAGNERGIRFYRAAGWEPTGAERVEDEWGAPELQLSISLA